MAEWPQSEIEELRLYAGLWGKNAAGALEFARLGVGGTRLMQIHGAQEYARKAWRCADSAVTLEEMTNE